MRCTSRCYSPMACSVFRYCRNLNLMEEPVLQNTNLIHIEPIGSNSCRVRRHCMGCQKDHESEFPVAASKVQAYVAGHRSELVPSFLLQLTDTQLEMLLTGICDPCWNRLFKGEQEKIDAGDDPGADL